MGSTYAGSPQPSKSGGQVGQEKVSTLAQAGLGDPREALKGDAEETDWKRRNLETACSGSLCYGPDSIHEGQHRALQDT